MDAWREQQRQHHRKRVSIDGSWLATFLKEVSSEEALLAQQQRDLEGMSIREAIGGPSKITSLPPGQSEVEMGDELDLATLPHYEEYC